MIGTSAGVAASLLHGYLFLKMEASREPIARFWGDQFPGIAAHLWCALSVLKLNSALWWFGSLHQEPFLLIRSWRPGFRVDPVTSSFKNRWPPV